MFCAAVLLNSLIFLALPIKKFYFVNISIKVQNTIDKRYGMILSKEQKRFDEIKWFDSIQAGLDKCGEYEFCSECNKALSYPCARAARRYTRGVFRVATIAVKRRTNND